MKKFKVIIWILAVFLIIFFVAAILVALYAPKIIEQQIQQNLKLNVRISKVSLSLPFTVTLTKIEVADFASIKGISLSPNLIALLFGKVVIHGLTIVDPVINLVQSQDGKLNLPVLEQKGKPPAVYLTSLNVKNGKIIFTDRKVRSEGLKFIVNKLNIKVAKVSMPITSLATNFNINAELLNYKGDVFGSIDFGGWLDYLERDMDAELKIKNLDIANFAPYYGNFISNKPISSAMVNSNSTFKSDHNALEIVTDFNLSKIVYEKTETEETQPVFDLVNKTLDIFTDADGSLRLQFKIETQMDKPSLSKEKIMSIILKAAMKNLANQSPQQLVDKVANAIDKYKDIGKELKNIFGGK